MVRARAVRDDGAASADCVLTQRQHKEAFLVEGTTELVKAIAHPAQRRSLVNSLALGLRRQHVLVERPEDLQSFIGATGF